MTVVDARVARLSGPRELHFSSEPLDTSQLGPGQILARTDVTVLSVGTELAAFTGAPPLRPGPVYPRVVGYCNVATVEAVGPGVDAVAPGRRVLTHQSHRSAFMCSADDVLVVLPDDVDVAAAATAYLFHLGYVALLNADVQVGRRVAVIGLGVLGIGTVASARLAGAPVAGFSGSTGLRRLAERFGAGSTHDKADPAAAASYVAATGQGGADVVVVTGDAWSDWQLALEVVRPRGIVSIVGFPGRREPNPPFNPLASQYVYDKQLRIQSSGWTPARSHAADRATELKRDNLTFLVDRIADGSLPARLLISSEHRWDELASVYADLADSRADTLTCLIRWSDA